jgi:hypothetical protein
VPGAVPVLPEVFQALSNAAGGTVPVTFPAVMA